MKYIKTLLEHERVVEHYLCKKKESRESRAGKTFFSLKLQDKTGVIEATVDVTEMMGAETYLYLTCEGVPLTVRISSRSHVRPQDVMKLAIDPNAIHLFDADDEHSILA